MIRREVAARLRRPVGRDVPFGAVREEVHTQGGVLAGAPRVVRRVDVTLEPALHETLNVGVEEVVVRRVARTVHREDAERPGGMVLLRVVPEIDAQQCPGWVHRALRRVLSRGPRRGRRPFGLVPQERVVTAVAGVAPHHRCAPRDLGRTQSVIRLRHSARHLLHEPVDQLLVVARDQGHLEVVGALREEMARARVGVSRRDDQAVGADRHRIREQSLRNQPLQRRRDQGKVRDHERYALAACILEHERPRIQP